MAGTGDPGLLSRRRAAPAGGSRPHRRPPAGAAIIAFRAAPRAHPGAARAGAWSGAIDAGRRGATGAGAWRRPVAAAAGARPDGKARSARIFPVCASMSARRRSASARSPSPSAPISISRRAVTSPAPSMAASYSATNWRMSSSSARGRVRAPAGSGIAVVQDRALEAEADRLGARAAVWRLPVQAKLASGAACGGAAATPGPPRAIQRRLAPPRCAPASCRKWTWTRIGGHPTTMAAARRNRTRAVTTAIRSGSTNHQTLLLGDSASMPAIEMVGRLA